MLGGTALAAADTVQAIHSFQQQRALIRSGDIHTIRPWMTIPYIAHTYHVPERYLCTKLGVAYNSSARHKTMHTLAILKQQPVEKIIQEVQQAILIYHKRRSYSHTLPARYANRMYSQGKA